MAEADRSYARNEGRGVFIEVDDANWEMEETLRAVAEEFSGDERYDIDEAYQFNFITFEFDTYEVALEVVNECNSRCKGDYNTIEIDDIEVSF